jgi:hypothetical protein
MRETGEAGEAGKGGEGGMGEKSGCWDLILWTTDINVGEKSAHVYGNHFARPLPDQVGTVQA